MKLRISLKADEWVAPTCFDCSPGYSNRQGVAEARIVEATHI